MIPSLPGPPDYVFDLDAADRGEALVGIGGNLSPATLLEAYCSGVFPMGAGPRGGPPLGWWCPDPRGILRLGDLRLSRSLRRSMRRFDFTVDEAFEAVLAGCADPAREGAWITPEIGAAYLQLHRLGWAHSIEVWSAGELVGGLYGVAVGGLFAGESMFHRVTDASKAALVVLVDLLADDGDPRRFVDLQWLTAHLASLGGCEVSRPTYLALLRQALQAPMPGPWG